MSSVQCLQIFSKYLVADYQIKVRESERERERELGQGC